MNAMNRHNLLREFLNIQYFKLLPSMVKILQTFYNFIKILGK